MSYVESLLDKLSGALKPVSEDLDADATVALLLRTAGQDLQILFVKRVESQTDPWSGQMALPGGKREAKDKNIKQTVVRETLEETGINLLDRSRFLGVMSALHSRQRPQIRILTFIVLLEHVPSIRLNQNELEGFFWISLKEFVQHKGTARFSFGKFPAYIFENNVIWGLTYTIIEKFLKVLESSK